MKTFFLAAALLVALSASLIWFAAGANRGWTKTEVQVKTLDEVTGIEGLSYRKQFQPGVDFLGGALGGAGLLFGIGFFLRSKSTTN